MTTVRFEIISEDASKMLHAVKTAFPHLVAPAETCDHPALIEEYEGRIATLHERITSLEETNKEQARVIHALRMDASKTDKPAEQAKTSTRTASPTTKPARDWDETDEIPF